MNGKNRRNSNRSGLKSLLTIVTTFFILAMFSVVAFGQQETGQIIGTVTDQNGAVVPGATIVVKNLDNGREVTVTANSEGGYIVPNLQPGLYEVTTKASGFQNITEKVQVTVGAKLPLTTKLGVVGGTETVTVVAGGIAEVNTIDQQLSNVVTTKQITELPTLTRNPYALVGLSGNASDSTADGDADSSIGRGVGFSINGQRSASTGILLDGAENVDLFTASIGQPTPLDSVGEFRVITGNFSAEYGRATGGIVNAVTKAGTNEFHGTAYEFNRVSRLAANTYNNNSNNTRKGVFARNQFGYSVGGPVVKNKLFFFNSTEWTRVRSQDTIFAYIPTPAFIAASAPATRNFFSQYGTLAGNTRRTGRTFTPALTGAPPIAGPLFEEVAFTVPINAGGGIPGDYYQTVTRVDWNLSDKTQIFGRYAIDSQGPTPGNYDISPYQGFTVGTTGFNQNALLSLTRQITPKLISQTKLAYNRLNGENSIGSDPNTPTLSGDFGGPSGSSIYFPGFLSIFPGIGLPSTGPQNLAQLNEDISYVAGNHSLRFGGQVVYIQSNTVFPAFQNASQVLGTNADTVVNNLFNGTLAQFTGAVNPQGRFPGQTVTLPVGSPDFSRSNRYNEFALYFNDSWRFSPRLTFNLGVRYEYYGVQHNKNPQIESNFFLGSGATLPERVRNGVVRTTPDSGGLWAPDKNNFAPRVGFAWDVFGDGRTSVRGGYGLSYERNFGNVTFNVIQNPPNYATLALTPADLGTPIPIFTNSAGPLGGNPGVVRTLPRVSLRAVDENIVNAYSHSWTLIGEREIAKNTVASIAYSGSAGRNLYSIANLNRLNSGIRFLGTTVACPPFGATSRLNCQYTDINYRGNQGYSDYHGVTFSLDSNDFLGIGLTMTNRYTYSVAKDNLSSTFTDGFQSNSGYRLGFTDPYNPSLDYGYADFDIRHRFTSSYVYELPFGKNMTNSWARNLIGNWTLTGLVTISSGAPFTIFDCSNTIRAFTCPRLQVSGPIRFGAPERLIDTGNPNEFTYIDLSGQTLIGAYTDPYVALGGVAGTDSGPYPANMAPRNAFRGPGNWNVSMGLYKGISLTERFKMQIRGEIFNLFNHSNLYINGATTDASGGNVTASRGVQVTDHRNIQLAIKFIF